VRARRLLLLLLQGRGKAFGFGEGRRLLAAGGGDRVGGPAAVVGGFGDRPPGRGDFGIEIVPPSTYSRISKGAIAGG